MYCVFAPGFFRILPFTLRTISFPNDIHVRGM
jgi:hypothetical protein